MSKAKGQVTQHVREGIQTELVMHSQFTDSNKNTGLGSRKDVLQ